MIIASGNSRRTRVALLRVTFADLTSKEHRPASVNLL